MNDKYVAIQYLTCCVQSLSLLCGFVLRYLFFPDTKQPKTEPDESWVNIVCLYRTPEEKSSPESTRTPELRKVEGVLIHEHFLDTNSPIHDTHYYIEETYQTYDHEELGDEHNAPTYISATELAEMHYSHACITASRISKQEPNIAEIVVWSRDTHRDEQIVNIWSSKRSPFPVFKKDIIYSNVVFLHIEYRHPNMGEVAVEITLPKQLMIVGNELFSPAFLYRWLKYFSNVPFIFDEAYCVYLMDDNLKQQVLRYGDYIVLGKTDVELVKQSSITVEDKSITGEDSSS